MSEVPTTQVLAKRVTEALRMMFDGSIIHDETYQARLPTVAAGRIVTVPLIGAPNYLVTLQANGPGTLALASAMFSCARHLATDAMIDDSMCELANMVAGQVRALMARENQVGTAAAITSNDMLTGAKMMVGARLLIGDALSHVEVVVAEFSPPQEEAQAPAAAAPTIAIAEDDEVTLSFVKTAVESAGMRVTVEARNGFQALNEIRRLRPDVACLDINMPEMSGLEVLATLRKEVPNMVIFLVSSFATVENVREAIRLRANGIIVKPFVKARIISEIEKALAKRTLAN